MVAKQPGCATDHPHPSSAESKNAWNYTSTHTCLHRVVGYKVREQFLQDQQYLLFKSKLHTSLVINYSKYTMTRQASQFTNACLKLQ